MAAAGTSANGAGAGGRRPAPPPRLQVDFASVLLAFSQERTTVLHALLQKLVRLPGARYWLAGAPGAHGSPHEAVWADGRSLG